MCIVLSEQNLEGPDNFSMISRSWNDQVQKILNFDTKLIAWHFINLEPNIKSTKNMQSYVVVL